MIQKAYSATNKMCELYKEKFEMEELGKKLGIFEIWTISKFGLFFQNLGVLVNSCAPYISEYQQKCQIELLRKHHKQRTEERDVLQKTRAANEKIIRITDGELDEAIEYGEQVSHTVTHTNTVILVANLMAITTRLFHNVSIILNSLFSFSWTTPSPSLRSRQTSSMQRRLKCKLNKTKKRRNSVIIFIYLYLHIST